MSRPASHTDLADDVATIDVATFKLDQLIDIPDAVAAYATFLTAVRKAVGARATSKYDTTTVARPRTTAELDELLTSAQTTWDGHQKRYNAVRDAFEAATTDSEAMAALSPKWQDYEAWTLRSWAEKESRPVFLLIDKNDTVREAARAAVGIE